MNPRPFADPRPARLKLLSSDTITTSPHWLRVPRELREGILAAALVLPFRTNEWVLDNLIDWNNVPEDPVFRLTFPQPEMLAVEDLGKLLALMRLGSYRGDPEREVARIRASLNPHPSGQRELNIPKLGASPAAGLQHKYSDTVLFFPAAGQTCHAYCTYCFRWAQFVGPPELRFQARESDELLSYLDSHPEVSDVLVTGGDPMVMSSTVLRRYLTPLLHPKYSHVRNIRIGTKSLSFWPFRFLTDPDCEDLLRLFEEVVSSGRHLAVMVHFSHPVEMMLPEVRQAVARIRGTGAELRMQTPIIRGINDRADLWAQMWTEGTSLGMIPYYAFVERDTGPRSYFEVSLARAHEIFRQAYSSVSGLARTVRGPSMSCTPGKVRVVGITELGGERVFVLDFLRSRDPSWVGQPFFAAFDPAAVWFDQLRPAFGAERFFFEDDYAPPYSGVNHTDDASALRHLAE